MNTPDRVSRLRNPDPTDLRHAATVGGMTWLPVFASAGLLIADALEIADESSRALIECSCITADSKLPERWYDTWAVSAEDKEPIRQAVRYLEARRLLTRDEKQPHLVHLIEAA